jgi:hypothetical protein
MDCVKKKYNNKNIAKKQAKFYERIYKIKSFAYGCKFCGRVHLSTRGKVKSIT